MSTKDIACAVQGLYDAINHVHRIKEYGSIITEICMAPELLYAIQDHQRRHEGSTFQDEVQEQRLCGYPIAMEVSDRVGRNLMFITIEAEKTAFQ